MSILQDDIMNIDDTTITSKVSFYPPGLSFMSSKWLKNRKNSEVAIKEIQQQLNEIRIMDFEPLSIKKAIEPMLYPRSANKFVLQQINERKFFYYIKETRYSKPAGFMIEI